MRGWSGCGGKGMDVGGVVRSECSFGKRHCMGGIGTGLCNDTFDVHHIGGHVRN